MRKQSKKIKAVNDWQIIADDGITSVVRCACGEEHCKRTIDIANGKSKRCRKCAASVSRFKRDTPQWRLDELNKNPKELLKWEREVAAIARMRAVLKSTMKVIREKMKEEAL